MTVRPITTDVLEVLGKWAQGARSSEAFDRFYVFGSLINDDGAQFLAERSDVDIIVVFSPAVRSPWSRVEACECLLPQIAALEDELTTLLGRDRTSRVTSFVAVTDYELENDIHKSGVAEFFTTNFFLDLLLQTPPAPLSGSRSNIPMAHLVPVQHAQKIRNLFLAISAEDVQVLQPWNDATDAVPKDLARTAAQFEYFVKELDGDRHDVNRGLEYVSDMVNEAATRCVKCRDLKRWLAARRGGRGVRRALQQSEYLLLWELLAEEAISASPRPALADTRLELPMPTVFYGREIELQHLSKWLITDRLRLVGVFGMRGIGKTSTVAVLAHTLRANFQKVVWWSLRDRPRLASALRQINARLADTVAALKVEDDDLATFLSLLRNQRCLVVFDDLEAIMEPTVAGQYRPGHEEYAQALERLAVAEHDSCVCFLSAEHPLGFPRTAAGVAFTRLDGLDPPSTTALLRANNIQGSDAALTTLAAHFSGNPLALNWASESIRSLFGGDASAATRDGLIVFNGLQELLNDQISRLSRMEREILVWLAVTHEPLRVEELLHRPAVAPRKVTLLAALKSLARRFLLQTTADGIGVPTIVGEYLIQQFVASAVEELQQGTYDVLHTFPLIQPTGTHEALQIQQREQLAAVARDISTALGGDEAAVAHLCAAMQALPRQVNPTPSFVAGNLLNVLRALGADATAMDLSRLCVWQSDLRDMVLRDTNMQEADLSRSVFTRTVGNALCVRFHPDDSFLVAGTTHGEIHVFDMPTLNHVSTLRGHSDWVRAIAFSSDGALMASGGEDQRVRIWSIRNWEVIHELRGHTNRIRTLAFSPDGTLLGSGSTDGTIRLWSMRTGRCVRRLREHTDWVRAIDFAGDLLASGGSDRTVRLWRTRTGEALHILRGHTATVRCLAFHPDGKRLATGSSDRTIRVWNVVTGRCIGVWRSHTDRVRSLAFTADGRLLFSGGGDGHIVIWDTERGLQVGTLDGHKNQIWSVASTRNGDYLASTSEDQTMRLWQPISRRCKRVVHGYINQLWSVVFTKDGRHLLAGGGDKQIRIWDLLAEQPMHSLFGHTSWIRSLAVTNDDRHCASTGDDRTVRLWHLETRQSAIVGSNSQRLRAVALSPDGVTLAYAGKTSDIAFYNLPTGRRSRIRGLNHPTFTLSFSGDNRLLATGGSDSFVRVWDYRTHRLEFTLDLQAGWIRGITFTPVGAALAVAAEDRKVYIWPVLGDHVRPKVLEGHSDRIWSIAASPQRPLVATASDDGTIRVWNCITGRCETVLEGHASPVRSVAFDGDGSHVASGSYDGVVKVWNIDTARCVKTLRAARPYEGMRLSGVIGLTRAQVQTLKAFGAVD